MSLLLNYLQNIFGIFIHFLQKRLTLNDKKTYNKYEYTKAMVTDKFNNYTTCFSSNGCVLVKCLPTTY